MEQKVDAIAKNVNSNRDAMLHAHETPVEVICQVYSELSLAHATADLEINLNLLQSSVTRGAGSKKMESRIEDIVKNADSNREMMAQEFDAIAKNFDSSK